MAMGNWKTKQFSKKTKRSFTKSNKAKIYFAIPPAEGWPPFNNNYSAFGVRNSRK